MQVWVNACGVVVHIFKKVDQRVCSNYRGISLLLLPKKVLQGVGEETPTNYQTSGPGTVDQIFTLAELMRGS